MAKKQKPARERVDGKGRSWYIYAHDGRYWNIVDGPYLTKRRADKELERRTDER